MSPVSLNRNLNMVKVVDSMLCVFYYSFFDEDVFCRDTKICPSYYQKNKVENNVCLWQNRGSTAQLPAPSQVSGPHRKPAPWPLQVRATGGWPGASRGFSPWGFET